jgi:hypothetical protein
MCTRPSRCSLLGVITQTYCCARSAAIWSNATSSCVRGFWQIDRAAGLRRQLFHAALGGQLADVSLFVQTRLDHVDLTIVGQHVLDDESKSLCLLVVSIPSKR